MPEKIRYGGGLTRNQVLNLLNNNPGGGSGSIPVQPAGELFGANFMFFLGGSTSVSRVVGVGLSSVSWSLYWLPPRPINANLFTMTSTLTAGTLPDELDRVDFTFDATALTAPPEIPGDYTFAVVGFDNVSKQQLVFHGILRIR